jgi:hypothetical protein
MLVDMLDDKFVLYVDLKAWDKETKTGFFRNREISMPYAPPEYSRGDENKRCITILLDDTMSYIRHINHDRFVHFLATNSSNVLIVCDFRNFKLYDSDLRVVEGRSFARIVDRINDSISEIDMNDQNIFLLCQSQLQIFDLATLDLVRTISGTSAWQMKRISNEYMALFNRHDRRLHLYDQVNFEHREAIDLEESVPENSTISRDKSQLMSFYTSYQMERFTI